MSNIHEWFRQRTQGVAADEIGNGKARCRPASRRRMRPSFLLLEDRRLMAMLITVTDPGDSGPGTLRDAVAQADQANQPVEIQFGLPTGASIALTSGQLELSNANEPVSIEGPGAGGLTIDASEKYRVFQIDPNVTASISGLTLTGGNPGYYQVGGEILNNGKLTLTGVTATGGTAYQGGNIFNTGTETLDDCTISDGSANRGAGLMAYGTTKMVNCSVTGNVGIPYGFATADSGAGITFYGIGLTIIGGSITNNSATRASAIDVYASYGLVNITGTTISGNACYEDMIYSGFYSNTTLTDCTISGNFSPSINGAGVQNSGGQLTLVDCTVEDFLNTPLNNGGTLEATDCQFIDNSGGGVLNLNTAELTGCTISGNTVSDHRWYSVYAAGVTNRGTIALNDCTISGNQATATTAPRFAKAIAGGLYNGGTATLTGCTVSGNSTAGSGGGLYSGYAATLTDTIVAGNTANSVASDIAGLATGSYNLIGTGGSGGLTTAGHNLLNVANPGLTTLGDFGGPTETMALKPGSPAIRAGVAVTGVTTDQRGFPLDSPPDIGAYQTRPGPLVVNTAVDGTGSALGQLSLRQAVNLANVLPGGQTITFGRSAFAGHSVIDLTAGQLELSNVTGAVNIIGPGARTLAISGGGESRVFQVDQGASASVIGLTITGGVTTGDGGGVLNDGTLSLAGVAVVGNSAANGGGVDNMGTALIVGSAIDENSASADGGGIFNTGKLTVTNSTLATNSAGADGGGLYNRGLAILALSTVEDNSASAGGGIFADASGQPVALIGTLVKQNKQGNIFGQFLRL